MQGSFIGKQFNSWTVINTAAKRYSGNYWLCRCTCGTEREVAERTLKIGTSTNCGCKRKHKFTDMTGKRFGKLTAHVVVKYTGY